MSVKLLRKFNGLRSVEKKLMRPQKCFLKKVQKLKMTKNLKLYKKKTPLLIFVGL